MNRDQKWELKGLMALADQAIAPLTNLGNHLARITKEEIEWLYTQDLGSNATVLGLEKTKSLQSMGENLLDVIDQLNELKDKIEKY